MDLATEAPRDTPFVAVLRRARAWWPREAAYSMRLAATSIFAMYLCMLFELDTPEWAGWTVIAVTLATRANSLQKSLWRGVGTVVGAAVALALVAAFAQDTLAFDIGLAAWVAFVTFMATIQRGLRTYGFALAGYTVPIITLNDVQHPGQIFLTAVDRCSTLLVGVACAYASSVLVARGVRSVRRELAGEMDDAVERCGDWSRAVREGEAAGAPPVGTVLALDTAIFDAFTEQPSLRTGGRAIAHAPVSLLHLLTVNLLRRRLPDMASQARALVGAEILEDLGEWDRLDIARQNLRTGARDGWRRVPAKPLALDWDARRAALNALRAVLAVSIANAFWYVSNWPPGATMVSWTTIMAILYANRDDGVAVTRNFLLGAVLASAVGVVTHYVVLAQSSSLEQLVLVLFPLLMLATMGYAETQAATGGGFAFVLLDAVSPDNVMRYDLGATLNNVLALVLGMGIATASFAFLIRPASAAVRRERAERRMGRSLRAIGLRPARLLPARDASLARMWQRLAAISEDAAAAESAQDMLLIGVLLRALRHDDDRLGRAAANALFADNGSVALARLAEGAAPLQADRGAAIAALMRTDAFTGWPAAPRRFPA